VSFTWNFPHEQVQHNRSSAILLLVVCLFVEKGGRKEAVAASALEEQTFFFLMIIGWFHLDPRLGSFQTRAELCCHGGSGTVSKRKRRLGPFDFYHL